VENLLDNAIKFTPSRARIQIACHLSSTDGVRLTVTDSGRGVALADRERIFDKYQRLDGHAGAGRTSRGLGLAFCRMAATAHGGEIHVEDGPEGGARFVVTLPAERVHHG
jgi:two-component system sensor histidine kinase KdpD